MMMIIEVNACDLVDVGPSAVQIFGQARSRQPNPSPLRAHAAGKAVVAAPYKT